MKQLITSMKASFRGGKVAEWLIQCVEKAGKKNVTFLRWKNYFYMA